MNCAFKDENTMNGVSGNMEIMSPLPPKTMIRREVTRSESKESTALLKQNYMENSSKSYVPINDIFDQEEEGIMLARAYSDKSPLIFQSTLSSLSKEDTSSEDADVEEARNNKDSIFRTRKEDTMVHLEKKHTTQQSNNQIETNCNIIHNQVTIQMEKSVEYPSHKNYPSEVIIDPQQDRRSLDNVELALDKNKSSSVQIEGNCSKKWKASLDLLVNLQSIDYCKVLYSFRQAFVDFSFLLPSLKPHVIHVIQQADRNICSSTRIMDLSPAEVIIAKRRLLSAVCAFGGYKISNGHSDSASAKSQRELQYEQLLPFRYFENKTRLSWDKEEFPPVENIQDDGRNDKNFNSSNHEDSKQESASDKAIKKSLTGDDPACTEEGVIKRSNESPKAKYRCKLCGQPKQNHTCPYQQSLQRSIGSMTYPALNAFECEEPGKLAPTLSEMNNFFNLADDDDHHLDTTLSNCDSFGQTIHGLSIDRDLSKMEFSTDGNIVFEYHVQSLKTKKRKIAIQSSSHTNDRLLLSKAEIRPEQYRTVSKDNSSFSSYGSYKYSVIPLSYAQRTCISDSLYNLSKSNIGLLDEVSTVLDEAQQSKYWDVAVAELLTQVLVVQCCPLGDNRLEGLRQYLLSFGVSC